MTEEAVVEQEIEVADTEPEQEVDSVEQEARKQGWAPKEEWRGDPDQWKDAKTFVKDGELYKVISEQGKTIKELKNMMAEQAASKKEQELQALKRQLAELQAERREAIEAGDVDMVETYDKQVQEAQQQLQTQTKVELAPEAQDFLTRNSSWYNDKTPENQKMADIAFEHQQYLVRINGARATPLTSEQILKETEERVKAEFPHRFPNPKRSAPAAVTSPSEPLSEVGGPKGSLYNKLTKDQKASYTQLKQKLEKAHLKYSVEEYVEVLRKHGQFKG